MAALTAVAAVAAITTTITAAAVAAANQTKGTEAKCFGPSFFEFLNRSNAMLCSQGV